MSEYFWRVFVGQWETATVEMMKLLNVGYVNWRFT